MSYAHGAVRRVFDAVKRDGGINTSDGVRALAGAMFAICKAGRADGGAMSQDEIVATLALLTGMACAALDDYAKLLEEEGQ